MRARRDRRGRIRGVPFPFARFVLIFLALAAAFPRPGSAARLESKETVRLGGIDQFLWIRGDDPARNPVLLFVHGGPGFPGGVTARVNAELERDFTVVHWDQRGAGHAYYRGLPEEAMKLPLFVDDTLELSRRLARRFGQRKIFLVGHSWGTLVSALAAARRPELFHAFVSIAQLADFTRTKRERAARLPPSAPLLNARIRLALAGWLLASPEYEVARTLRGFSFSSDVLTGAINSTSLFTRVPRLDVPVWFFAGPYDRVVLERVIAAYFQALRAPRGKRYLRFERSSHWPHLEEPKRFAAEMRAIRAAVGASGAKW